VSQYRYIDYLSFGVICDIYRIGINFGLFSDLPLSKISL
jgi:hypothetical protein